VAASSHIVDVRFDAQGLVANAGLILPATLGERLGLPSCSGSMCTWAGCQVRPTRT